MSYAGLDDIMMTCTSSKSRNYTLGKLIGENRSTDEINTYKNTTTIEGLSTSSSIYNLSKQKNINLPITNIIYNILYNNKNYNSLIKYLEKNCWTTQQFFIYIPSIITTNLSIITKLTIKDNL